MSDRHNLLQIVRGVDYDSCHLILSLTASECGVIAEAMGKGWPIHQLHVMTHKKLGIKGIFDLAVEDEEKNVDAATVTASLRRAFPIFLDGASTKQLRGVRAAQRERQVALTMGYPLDISAAAAAEGAGFDINVGKKEIVARENQLLHLISMTLMKEFAQIDIILGSRVESKFEKDLRGDKHAFTALTLINDFSVFMKMIATYSKDVIEKLEILRGKGLSIIFIYSGDDSARAEIELELKKVRYLDPVVWCSGGISLGAYVKSRIQIAGFQNIFVLGEQVGLTSFVGMDTYANGHVVLMRLESDSDRAIVKGGHPFVSWA
ncbi:MAG: hypothetical protein Hyperionvirus36_16 [Hyperionvirus sp.]|uniref:Uncharacterized protein n=1 Tax=Hyperionvirus sp. TaxID=2487770 RepID=A0A3G5AH61_9VIRU|nr:MAG: hypothetical protein Hyperionvirus36_16 [Hyperionvirus sp.]